ncbi:MAG: GxxExxY protein [Gemmatimonadales bacterium]
MAQILNHGSTEGRGNTEKGTGVGASMLRFEELSSKVIGAALAVHRELGPGFLESVYHSAMRVSLAHRTIPFESQFPPIHTFARRISMWGCCLISMHQH